MIIAGSDIKVEKIKKLTHEKYSANQPEEAESQLRETAARELNKAY